ncbi:hypothetical protein OC844_007519, partial [Tilletia horrida]
MYCLRWWIPLFLLPFPTAPPSFLLLFIIAYVFHTRPCAYCGVIIVGLFVSSCYWYLDLVPADHAVLPRLRLGLGLAEGPQALSGNASGAGVRAEEALGVGAGTTFAQQAVLAAVGLWTSASAGGGEAAGAGSKTRWTSWLEPVRLLGGASGSGAAGRQGATEGRAARDQAAEKDAEAEAEAESAWSSRILRPLRRRASQLSVRRAPAPAPAPAPADEADACPADGLQCASAADSTSTLDDPASAGARQFTSSSASTSSFNHAHWDDEPMVRCPGSGRCWLDFSLMASHGLFGPSPSYRLPQGGCRASSHPGLQQQQHHAQTVSSSSSSSTSTKFPTLQELLEDAKRQVEQERAYQDELRRKIEEEQAEVVQVVVAAEREEEEEAAAASASAAAAEASALGQEEGSTAAGAVPPSKTTAAPAQAAQQQTQHQHQHSKSKSKAQQDSSSSSSSSSAADAAAAAAAAQAKREERQSRARRIRSRSRKPAFRKAVPELDGEQTRGTYWIGVPGTAV